MTSKSHHYIALSNLDPDTPIPKPKIKPLLKMAKTIKFEAYAFNADETNKKIRKKRLTQIQKISFELSSEHYFKASQIRKLASNLKQVKHLSCLDFNMMSQTRENVKAIPALFQSLKFLKNRSKIHIFPASLFGEDNPFLSPLIRALENLRSLSKIKIKLSFEICRQYRGVRGNTLEPNIRRLLRTLANHKCFTCLHFNFHLFYAEWAIEEMMEILKSSKSLSHLELTFGGLWFRDSTQWEKLFRRFKTLKLVKNLRVKFNSCVISYTSLKEVGLVLKEYTQIRNLHLIFIARASPLVVSKVEWWLFIRSLRNVAHFQNVQAESKILLPCSYRQFFPFMLFSMVLVLCLIMHKP